MDFASDGFADGLRCRTLNIVDDLTNKCLPIEVEASLQGGRVVAGLERLSDAQGLPSLITTVYGPKFAAETLAEWAYRAGLKLNFQ